MKAVFVAVNIVEQSDNGIIAKLHNILTKPKMWVEQREVRGSPFAVLHIKPGRANSLPHEEDIFWVARDLARWILLPEESPLALSENASLHIYRSESFDREVLLATACAIVDRSRMPMYRRVLGLLDPDGSYTGMLGELLKYYTSVKVFTENTDRYMEASRQMMEELGAPVLVCESLSSLHDCVLILSPGPFSSREEFRLPCPVLTQEDQSLDLRYSCDKITRLQIALPADIPVPQGIPPHQMGGALHELCGVTLDLCAKTMLYNHKLVELGEVVHGITQLSQIVTDAKIG